MTKSKPLSEKEKKITHKDIKKGFRFYWTDNYISEFSGVYEVICFRGDYSVILCYKPIGIRATIREERLAKFDERIFNNRMFKKI